MLGGHPKHYHLWIGRRSDADNGLFATQSSETLETANLATLRDAVVNALIDMVHDDDAAEINVTVCPFGRCYWNEWDNDNDDDDDDDDEEDDEDI